MRGVSEIQRLRNIVTQLRAPYGCPWDREQTHHYLLRCLVEEVSEVLEAIDNNDAFLQIKGDARRSILEVAGSDQSIIFEVSSENVVVSTNLQVAGTLVASDISVNNYVRASHISTNYITTEDFDGKMRKWKETTSTSPSGRHLGHYKVLVSTIDRSLQEDVAKDLKRI